MASHQSSNLLTRRRILQGTGLGLLAGVTYAYFRGVRYPTISLEPAMPPSRFNYSTLDAHVTDLIEIPTDLITTQANFAYRAFAPNQHCCLTPKKSKALP